MTKKQLAEKVDELIEKIFFDVTGEINRLIRTGAVELDNYDCDMRLPKVMLCVALQNLYEQYKPIHDRQLMKEIENLKHF